VASASFGKREREKEQRERAAAKRERRATRTSGEHSEHEDPEGLERFRVLSEAFAAGTIDKATYVAQRREILTALGMSDAFEE
jgi:hypothetical protein